MTNTDFFANTYMPYQEAVMTPKTCSVRYCIIKKYLLEPYGDAFPANISSSDINVVYDEMESRNLANNTIYGTRAALMSFFKMASEYGECFENPVKQARFYKACIGGGIGRS